MTTRELFNRWFRNKKKVPVFNEDVDIVCKANQIMTEDGESVEDMLKTGCGGSAPLKLNLIGSPIDRGIEYGESYWNIVPDNTFPEDFVTRRDLQGPPSGVPKSEVESVLNAPDGSLVILYYKFWDYDNENNYRSISRPIGLGVTYGNHPEYGCKINLVFITSLNPVGNEFSSMTFTIDLLVGNYGIVKYNYWRK